MIVVKVRWDSGRTSSYTFCPNQLQLALDTAKMLCDGKRPVTICLDPLLA